jgi:hypothetical protein
LNKISIHDQNVKEKQAKVIMLMQDKKDLNLLLMNQKNEIKIVKQNIRVKNNRINFLCRKLEILHAGFINYSNEFSKLYSRVSCLEKEQHDNSIGKWLRKNMHYQNYIKKFKPTFLEKEVKIGQDISKKFKEFMCVKLHISKLNVENAYSYLIPKRKHFKNIESRSISSKCKNCRNKDKNPGDHETRKKQFILKYKQSRFGEFNQMNQFSVYSKARSSYHHEKQQVIFSRKHKRSLQYLSSKKKQRNPKLKLFSHNVINPCVLNNIQNKKLSSVTSLTLKSLDVIPNKKKIRKSRLSKNNKKHLSIFRGDISQYSLKKKRKHKKLPKIRACTTLNYIKVKEKNDNTRNKSEIINLKHLSRNSTCFGSLFAEKNKKKSIILKNKSRKEKVVETPRISINAIEDISYKKKNKGIYKYAK